MKRLLLLAIFFLSILPGLSSVTNAEYDPCKIVRDEPDTHYQRFIKLYQDRNYKQAESVAKKIIDCMEYKDVRELYNAIQYRLQGDEAAERERKAALIEKLDKEVRTIPAGQVEKNLELYKRLSRLDPDNPLYKNKVAYYSKRLNEKREKKAAERERREKRLIRHYDYEHRNDYTVGINFYTSDMKSFPKQTRGRYIGVLSLAIYAHDSCHVWGNFQLQQGTTLYNPNQFLGEIHQKNHSLRPDVIEPVIILIPSYLDVHKPINIWIDDDTKKEFVLIDFRYN